MRLRMIILTCGAFWVAAFLLFSRHHAVLPVVFHSDEPGKADQILHNTRNFLHPQLMLEATSLLWRLAGSPPDPLRIAILGRLVSAAAGATAVVAFALAGYLLRGAWGLLACGVAVLLCPPLAIHAHAFKEDVWLIFGLSLAVFGMAWYGQRRSAAALIFLGVACGVAASCKYIGITALPVAMIFASPVSPPGAPRPRRAQALALLLWFAVAFALANHRAFRELGSFLSGLRKESIHAAGSHLGITSDIPNWRWFAALGQETTGLIRLLAGTFMVILAAKIRKRRPGEAAILLLTAASFGLLLFCSFFFNKYLLPVTVLLSMMAGLGIAAVFDLTSDWKRRSLRHLAPVALLLVLIARQAPLSWDYVEQIRDDGRLRLRAWIRENLSSASVIAQGHAVGLPLHGRLRSHDGGSITVTEHRFVDIRGPVLHELRRKGVTHLALTEIDYARYFDPYTRARPRKEQPFARGREFFADVFARGELLWESRPDPDTHSFVNPEVRLYRLPEQE